MQAVLKYQDGICFEASTESGHTVVIDGPLQSGGKNQGPRPMELVLLALGSCSGVDIALMLQKMRVRLDDFSIHLDGARREREPKVYEHIMLQYRLHSPDLSEAQAKRAVHLSVEKYCSVSEMLRATVNLSVQVFLNDQLLEEF